MIVILIVAVICEIIIARLYLNVLRKKNIIQPFLEDGPMHNKKKGTPTMGGISFVLTITILTLPLLFLIAYRKENFSLLFIFLMIFIAYALIGYKDDILKVSQKSNESGLTPKQKLIFQFVLAAILFVFLTIIKYDMSLNLIVFNLNLSNHLLQMIIYFVFILLMLVGMSNATNLTDGLDGLLTSTYIIALIPLEVIALIQDQFYVAVFITIVIGALIGFFLFNKYPAKMFMGDTGSLSLGALIVLISIILKVEFLLIIICLIYIWETFSVVLQVVYFKYTKKKYNEAKRIFLMAPYHHHLEKKGLTEVQIVFSCCGVQVLVSILALILYV